ncbi:glycoside hydrolase family 64 protein [Noviherbaspirillum pedocola]|uniref:GH64 domain-containing protein n=1 Tax=Noviherbaspirillum pedocola TaxID=2801341 RepID=A0A934W8Z9_9BURK|nr:glycoside hydrolase family 64 protein [Noviherbaspirillum pedocola]MBK4737428.1 hypothetical protein [Noviherbaspirillum pedocola]
MQRAGIVIAALLTASLTFNAAAEQNAAAGTGLRSNPFGVVSGTVQPKEAAVTMRTVRAGASANAGTLAWNKQVRFEFVNGTNGQKPDDQVYWAIIGKDKKGKFVHVDLSGKLVPMTLEDNKLYSPRDGGFYANYFHTLAEAKTITLPPIDSARIFFSIGEPMYIKVNKDVKGDIAYAGANIENPTDPNQKVIFDFIEMAIVEDKGIYINTTRVDHFGFPIRLRLQGADGFDGEVGEPLTESRDELFRKFTAEVPSEFKRLAQPPYRIIAPAHGDFHDGRNEANYLARYIDAVWEKYRDGVEDLVFANSQNMKFRGSVKDGEFVFHDEGDDPEKPKYTYRIKRKPTTAEALLGNGVLDDASGTQNDIEYRNQLHIQAQLCAALNRHVAETPEKWSDKSAYYPSDSAANWYSKFWHDHNLHGLSYGFAYDDVWDASASLHHTAPTTATITIGW